MQLHRQRIVGGSGVISSLISMRRLLAIAAILLLALGAGLAWSTPQISTYGGTASGGGRVIFWIDTHTAHSFSLDDRQLFGNAQLEHHVTGEGSAVWRFHTHDEHWRVHGHWVGHTTVHGSICHLSASPTGCPNGEHLQTFVAEAKSKK
jgi:hypothetical protein